MRNATLETALVLLVPFIAFLAAEEVHVSGILAVVAASFSITVNLTLDPRHQYPLAYRTRLQEDAVWPVLDFLLETFVFAYIGLQLKFVLADLAEAAEPGLGPTLVAAFVLLAAAIVLRLAGVYGLFGRWRLRGRRGAAAAPTGKETLLVGWTGMRGILTLAAAASVPETTASGAEFPGRDAIQAIALIVTLGTLLIQGTTMGWLARRLRFDLAGERAAAERLRSVGRDVVAGVPAVPGDPDRTFEKQRLALGLAVRDRRIDERTARELIEDIDLRQAAFNVERF